MLFSAPSLVLLDDFTIGFSSTQQLRIKHLKDTISVVVLQDLKSDAGALNDSSITHSFFLPCLEAAAEESACPQFPDSIAEDIEFKKISLSQTRRRRYRKISPSLATVDALRGRIFNEGYTLHQTITQFQGYYCYGWC
ncbi:hypothetical protein POM88_010461 [Heracleum sosnowskyi]|uniref:Uncharacterized protein n=1 Tax=Heracleum sosnowskyi TaxID=360622 RepID=A0AAD8IWJ1_9APIA|nr:hypothetical protein POM88_010461 [Heracleum sosnowskyi]